MALSDSQQRQLAKIGAGIFSNVVRDLWRRSQAKDDGMTFEEFEEQSTNSGVLAQYVKPSPFQKPQKPSQAVADYLSDKIQLLTFPAQDAYQNAERAVEKMADDLLTSLGLK